MLLAKHFVNKPGTSDKTGWHVKNAGRFQSLFLIHPSMCKSNEQTWAQSPEGETLTQALIIKRQFPPCFHSVQQTTIKELKIWWVRWEKREYEYIYTYLYICMYISAHTFINIHLTKAGHPLHITAASEDYAKETVLQILEARNSNNKYSMQGCQQLMLSLLLKHSFVHRKTQRTSAFDVLHTYTCLRCSSTESSRRQWKRIFTLPLSAGRLSEITVSGDKINKPAKQRAASLFISWSGKKRELGKGYVFIYK